MTNIDIPSTPSPSPQPAVPPPARPRRRLRRALFAIALLVTGGLIGAVVTTTSHGWERGYPGGWHSDHGPRGMHRGGFGDFGPRMFLPGRIERGVERFLATVDANTEQRQKIVTIVQKAADDIYPLRAQHLEGRRQMIEALAAATIDKAKIETLRSEQLKLADTATKRVSEAVLDAADVLSPAQRAELNRRIERWQRWSRG